MSTLYIAEHEAMPVVPGSPQIWSEPASVNQNVSYTGTAGQSAAFATTTRFISITSDGTFSYLVGSNPTATTAKFRVAAGAILTIAVKGGDKISAITNT